MSKDPAFLFYPGDYLRDTQTLSAKTQVAYDRIICEHMRNIIIAKSQLKFFTKRLSEDEIEELMFVLTEKEGGFQIEWVADSIEKRKAYTESRRSNRKKGSSTATHIYLIKDNKTRNIKIGNSVNPERRIIELKTQLHKNLILVCYSEKIEQKNETKLHKKFENYRLNGEWFDVSENDIINHMTNHMNIQLKYHMNSHMESENAIEEENKDVFHIEEAYEFLKLKSPEQIEIFEMQNKKSFPDYNVFITNFNSIIIENDVKWEPKILLARLYRLNINWDKTPKKGEQRTAVENLDIALKKIN